MRSFDSRTLRDASDVLRSWASNIHLNPDECPESWELGTEWIRQVRFRAAELSRLAWVLEGLSDVSRETDDVLGWVGGEP